MERTLGECTGSPPHRSFWREGLIRRAAGRDVEDWLIAQANARGWHGALVRESATLDVELRPEEIVVGLAVPHAIADARVFKLIVRIAQAGVLDPGRLAALARRERAEGVLHWLFAGVPEVERTAKFELVAAAFREPPRGYRVPEYRYEFSRLIRKPYRRAG